MIKWLFKYATVIFVFNTVLLAIESTKFFAYQIFLVLMVLFALSLLINPNQVKNILFHKAFRFLLILNIINLAYFLLFHSITEIRAIEYLLARAIQFSIIPISIYANYDYYKERFLYHLVYLVTLVIFLSLFIDIDIFSGRYSGIIWNPNMLSSFTVAATAVLFLKEQHKTIFDKFLVLVFLLISFATGSRSVLIAFVLLFLFKYSFSNRNILYAFIALAGYFFIINLDLNTSINRFSSQGLFNDRLLQYKYAYETILQNPIVGAGLDKYAYINSDLVPNYLKHKIISAHNGYLAILTQYGLIIGSYILFLIFKQCFQVTNWFRKYSGIERTYLFIIVYALFTSLYESLLTGINEFHTILFWFSIAFLSYSKFKKENGV